MAAPTGAGMSRPATERVGDALYPLYERLFGDDSDFVASVDEKLAQTLRDDPVEMFLSVALGYGLAVGTVLWLLGVAVAYAVLLFVDPNLGAVVDIPWPNAAARNAAEALQVPLFLLLSGLVLGSLGFLAGFGAPVGNLWIQAGARKREINVLMPDAVSFMYALSIGGLNQLEILEAVAEAEDVYGEVSREFQVILNETGYFDKAYRTTIRNRATQTPSDEFSQFLTDMLSILSSGGDMTEFLDQKKEKHMRTAKQQQEATLETLQLFGEMYLTLSLFPLLLIIMLVSVSLMSGPKPLLLTGTVYALIPLLSGGFIVMIATVKQDDPGDGYLHPADVEYRDTGSMLSLGPIEGYDDDYALFDEIRSREGTIQMKAVLRYPYRLFRERPELTLLLTVPLSLVVVGFAVASGVVPTSFDAFVDHYLVGTAVLVYAPVYITGLPFAVFYQLKQRESAGITNKLTDSLRKLASANDTGQTLLESFGTVAETSSGRLAREFEAIRGKVVYGTSMKQALVEMNNRYAVPRLARSVKLVSEAQEASSEITDVLSTAAQASENQDDLAREQKQGARMQMVIIIMAFLTMLGVIAILKIKFLGPMAQLAASGGGGGSGGAGGGFGGGIDVPKLEMYFFHAVTIQAVAAGFISGFMRSGKLLDGVKFAVVLLAFPMLVWLAT
ncbi:type II secretion system F family protein [Halosegnis marinus]|uniref:Type II secretion system F family protein n=1 Tax=Halosegnis marinus TaxID=3034023 RepID=A0ABD5ZLS3_9EURY|nr:type II secretion system F family protein [Halosegnis sp. DT85]